MTVLRPTRFIRMTYRSRFYGLQRLVVWNFKCLRRILFDTIDAAHRDRCSPTFRCVFDCTASRKVAIADQMGYFSLEMRTEDALMNILGKLGFCDIPARCTGNG